MCIEVCIYVLIAAFHSYAGDSETMDGNFNLEDIVTPINVDLLEKLLIESKYDEKETDFLVKGFREGFDIGYEGPTNRKDYSVNIPFKSVGSSKELWDKLMAEVRQKRYTGPYKEVPFECFIQSPIGLVPKANNKTKLIFHLSYDFKEERSVNHHTPKEKCSVKYNDMDQAVKLCLEIVKSGKKFLVFAKTDLSAAFRMIPLDSSSWSLMVMKAKNPNEVDGKDYYFIDKCLPFGDSISCSHFQRFSDALKHIFEYLTGRKGHVVNCLDDFLFISDSIEDVNWLVEQFIDMCQKLGVPIAVEKTEWGSTKMVFLGILLDGEMHILLIPKEKRLRAVNMLSTLIDKKKSTVKDLQRLAGYLNFLNRAIFPGRAFTRRMYAKFTSTVKDKKLKAYHHIRLDSEFKSDWRRRQSEWFADRGWIYLLQEMQRKLTFTQTHQVAKYTVALGEF